MNKSHKGGEACGTANYLNDKSHGSSLVHKTEYTDVSMCSFFHISEKKMNFYRFYWHTTTSSPQNVQKLQNSIPPHFTPYPKQNLPTHSTNNINVHDDAFRAKGKCLGVFHSPSLFPTIKIRSRAQLPSP